MIEACSASLVYYDHGKEVHACRAIDLRVNPGEFIGILGPSGSGKSSLLYLLAGLKEPTTGEVFYQGKRYSDLDDAARSSLRLREFGFVFQQPFLIGYLNALENVLIMDPYAKDATARAVELLGVLGLGDRLERMPSELSGGEKQRVCVARALFASPRVVFADEPTASLDQTAGLEVVDLMRRYHEGALVMVTHDPKMLQSADRVFSMSEGKAIEISRK